MRHLPRCERFPDATIVVLLLCATSAAFGWSGTGHPTAATDAETLRRHWKASVDAYTMLTEREPENGMAWFRLGTSLEHTANPAAAVVAFARAEALGYKPVEARYHLAVNHAFLGRQEVARDWLRRARGSGAASTEGDGTTLLQEILGSAASAPGEADGARATQPPLAPICPAPEAPGPFVTKPR